MMRYEMIVMFLLAGMSLGLSAQTEIAPPDVSYETDVSQTSVWPGDRIHYRITLTVEADLQVNLEDFDEQNVSFEPFHLIEIQQTREEVGEQLRYVFDYLLANYEIGDKRVEIPGLTFVYEKPGPTEANAPTTVEVQIPPLPMSVRSTLNQPVEMAWIQESLPLSEDPVRTWIPLVAGLAGLLVSSLPLGAWVWKKVPEWQARRQQLSRSQFLEQCLGSLNRLEKRLGSNGVEIKDQYWALEEVVGKYIDYFWDIQTHGLIQAELIGKLNQGKLLPGQSAVLAGIFEHGQSCRYSPDNSSGWEDAFREDVQEIKKLCV